MQQSTWHRPSDSITIEIPPRSGVYTTFDCSPKVQAYANPRLALTWQLARLARLAPSSSARSPQLVVKFRAARCAWPPHAPTSHAPPTHASASACIGHAYMHGRTRASILEPAQVSTRPCSFTRVRAHRHMHVYLYVCVRARAAGPLRHALACTHAHAPVSISRHGKAAAHDLACERARTRDNAQTGCIHSSTRALPYMKEPAHPVNSLGVLRGFQPRCPHLGQLLRRSPVRRVPRAQWIVSGCTQTAPRLPAFCAGGLKQRPDSPQTQTGAVHACMLPRLPRCAVCCMLYVSLCGGLSAQADGGRRVSLTQTRPSRSRPHRRQAATRSQRYGPTSPRCAMRSSCRAPNRDDAMLLAGSYDPGETDIPEEPWVPSGGLGIIVHSHSPAYVSSSKQRGRLPLTRWNVDRSP